MAGLRTGGFGVLAVVLLALHATRALAQPAPQATVDARDIIFPFACTTEGGRLVVSPSTERSYRIVGAREKRRFAFCIDGHPGTCGATTLHRFEIQCGRSTVPWYEVAAQILQLRGRDARLIGNGIRLDGRSTARLFSLPQRLMMPRETALLPARFAPLLGARIVEAPLQSQSQPQGAPQAAAPSRLSLSAQPPAMADPSPVAALQWTTTVTTASSDLLGIAPVRAAVLAALVLAAWTALVVARRRMASRNIVAATALLLSPPQQTEPAPGNVAEAAPVEPPSSSPSPSPSAEPPEPTESAEPTEAAYCSDLIAQAVRLHRATLDGLTHIQNDQLRAVLAADLAKVQASLLAPELTADLAAQRWATVRETVVRAYADLQRLAHIVAGVMETVGKSTGNDDRTPQTAHEAFDVLGLNPDAPPAVAKKVVDGLRQTWHPDHARDEVDRQRRETRLKRINIAWDLVRTRQAGGSLPASSFSDA